MFCELQYGYNELHGAECFVSYSTVIMSCTVCSAECFVSYSTEMSCTVRSAIMSCTVRSAECFVSYSTDNELYGAQYGMFYELQYG